MILMQRSLQEDSKTSRFIFFYEFIWNFKVCNKNNKEVTEDTIHLSHWLRRQPPGFLWILTERTLDGPRAGEGKSHRNPARILAGDEGLVLGKGKGGEPHLLVAKRRWEVVVEGSPVVQVCGGGGCSLAWWRSGEGKRGHPGRRVSRGRGGSVPWVGLLRGWPEMGSPRHWGTGGIRGSPVMVLGELGRGRSAKARLRSSSGGWKN